jgi:DNA-binding transcriptional ArsR family regulator
MLEMFVALAEENRYRIVELLRGGPLPVKRIGARLRLNQPQVSKHLRVLKDAGLVDVEPHAQHRVYELRGEPLRDMHDWLERYRRVWDQRFDRLNTVVVDLVKKEKAEARRKKK